MAKRASPASSPGRMPTRTSSKRPSAPPRKRAVVTSSATAGSSGRCSGKRRDDHDRLSEDRSLAGSGDPEAPSGHPDCATPRLADLAIVRKPGGAPGFDRLDGGTAPSRDRLLQRQKACVWGLAVVEVAGGPAVDRDPASGSWILA